jgi:hypothetical protein
MKFYTLALASFFACQLGAVEFEPQFENEQVYVAKVKLEPGEETGLHRDDLPRVDVALQGGTITRFEPNGSLIDVDFPTGQAVYLQPDPAEEFHNSVNTSPTPVELIVIQLKPQSPPEVF